MTVWFLDQSFHNEDNWGTHLQLLQKIQMLTDATEGKNHVLRAGAWNIFNRIKIFFFI